MPLVSLGSPPSFAPFVFPLSSLSRPSFVALFHPRVSFSLPTPLVPLASTSVVPDPSLPLSLPLACRNSRFPCFLLRTF
jgi:hypothetical protein